MPKQNGNRPRPRVQVQTKLTVNVDFVDGPYAGLWMKCARITSMKGYFTFARNAPEGASADEGMLDNAAKLQRFGSEILLEWNLDDAEGNPVPPTAEGMESIPLDLAFDLLNRWLEALTEIPAPLENGSSAGKPPAAASIPMAALS